MHTRQGAFRLSVRDNDNIDDARLYSLRSLGSAALLCQSVAPWYQVSKAQMVDIALDSPPTGPLSWFYRKS